jgi:hypothetical protein
MNKNTLLAMMAACSLLLSSVQVSADTIRLKTSHPDRHVVVKGDTLWDISARFLKDPWQWPVIWDANPAIKNPHLIFPGDIILLKFVEGQPVLWLERGQEPKAATLSTRTQTPDGQSIVRLSPQIRSSRRDEEAIPTIPSDAIKQFLKFPRIVSKQELDDAGYIVASEDGGLISGGNDRIYARGINPQEQSGYDVVRQGKTYYDKEGWGKEVLGYEMLHIADARVTRHGDPTTMLITSANREVLIGDQLLTATDYHDLNADFQPHAPETPVKGNIIAVLDGVSRIGQYHTVVINLGKRDHIETGHILAIYQAGRTIRDNVTDSWNNSLTLPDERAGTLMIVQPFERISYALVMEATKDMKVNDSVTNP